MKTQLCIFILCFTFFFLSCENKIDNQSSITIEYKNGKQIPILDSLKNDFGVLAPDTVWGEDQYHAQIWLTNKSEQLINVYAECNFNASLIDTTHKKLDNCNMKLETIKDTVLFYLYTMDTTCSHTFKLGFLTLDKQRNYHLKLYNLCFQSMKK